MSRWTCLEICAGAGGQSLGLEDAGFCHEAAVEIDPDACSTLRANRPAWKVVEQDVHLFDATPFRGIDLLAGGVPCPPFSIAGKQLGADDERDLFPQALRLVEESNPRAVMLENVRGLAGARFASFRGQVLDRLTDLGYEHHWRLVNASDYGVPQLRPRFVLVALKPHIFRHFTWPTPTQRQAPSVGATLHSLMAADAWPGADAWAEGAHSIGPTLVGGSRKHGGPDLGPTRARAAWLGLGVDGKGVANDPPSAAHPSDHIPRLTLRMTARLQGFPDSWAFTGRKTAAYRQIGNAFPPPVACAIGAAIANALAAARTAP